ncbi:regulator of chromosome condensation-like [Liolophura sinensis]|uniref:regulator of chromosome condensation-like n=1 Tax=Liolophura sinensis TaxID=3198878 RepID=UPI0031585FA0
MPPKRMSKQKRGNKAAAGATVPKRPKIEHRSLPNVIGEVLTHGEGDTGQLGLGENILGRKRPAKVDLPANMVQVCAGGMHTVCLTATGEVYSFGCNDEGALGRNTSVEGSETRPGKVDVPGHVVMLSAGDSHTAALLDNGQVYAWGNFRDGNGRMGLFTAGQQENLPVPLPIDIPMVKIASGGNHLVCLSTDSNIYTCGCAEQGQLGRVAQCFSNRGGRKGLDYVLKPNIVRCLRYKTKRTASFSDIWTGQDFTYAEESISKTVYGWGLNNYCQLGLTDMNNRYVPARLLCYSDEKKWLSIEGGIHHTVSLDENGKVYTHGRGDYGRLGLGKDCQHVLVPTMVIGIRSETCTGIAAGTCVSFAVCQDGKMYAWGMGTSKQLATGEEDDECLPVVMEGKQLETRAGVSISAGGQHTVILAREKPEDSKDSKDFKRECI